MVENLGRANFGAPHNFEQLKGLWEGEVVLDGEITGCGQLGQYSTPPEF